MLGSVWKSKIKQRRTGHGHGKHSLGEEDIEHKSIKCWRKRWDKRGSHPFPLPHPCVVICSPVLICIPTREVWKGSLGKKNQAEPRTEALQDRWLHSDVHAKCGTSESPAKVHVWCICPIQKFPAVAKLWHYNMRGMCFRLLMRIIWQPTITASLTMSPSFVSVTFEKGKSILMWQKNLTWELITSIW